MAVRDSAGVPPSGGWPRRRRHPTCSRIAHGDL